MNGQWGTCPSIGNYLHLVRPEFFKSMFLGQITSDIRDLKFRPNILTRADTLIWQTCCMSGQHVNPYSSCVVYVLCKSNCFSIENRKVFTLKYSQWSYIIKTKLGLLTEKCSPIQQLKVSSASQNKQTKLKMKEEDEEGERQKEDKKINLTEILTSFRLCVVLLALSFYWWSIKSISDYFFTLLIFFSLAT